eukprot:TRINITY_DN56391_c0_g1_i1.p1 TRINITY_DN56391_c0_g1~~TRINITY_DN56391_c0_g1_i1.p1  ORF type:complete len:356 (+),score=59.18 TRINITY_DN56391_c0_g1_i1:98-1165(+)
MRMEARPPPPALCHDTRDLVGMADVGGACGGWLNSLHLEEPTPEYDPGLGARHASQAVQPSPRSDEDLEECIAAWQRSSTHLHQCSEQFSLYPLPRMPAARSPVNNDSKLTASQHARVRAPAGPVLLVNVGGELFRSTASTLRRAPFFDSLWRHASEDGGFGTTLDSDGNIFVDRNAELFSLVLAYLQSGHWLLRDRVNDIQFVDALRDEANFYGLDATKDRLPIPKISEYATVWQFQEDASLYVDCLEQTIREDPDHQGLFRLCKYSGGLPLDQQTCTRRFKATSHSLQSVIAYFAMRGFSLQHVIEGSMITHTTSADGQNRSGPGVQYILARQTMFNTQWHTPPNSNRPDGET